ncbi:hypothetical protein COO60DRAFT_1625359 [Scenedesmus sp. NREL 46B-D3]|nr:hypothetical protein COO60DRAFT_1625359 [Scenedesmus sp. NREL 46B-D3]
MQRSTSSRTHDMADGSAPIKQTKHRFKVVCWYELAVLIAFFGLSLLQLIDEQGVNRTPKPLVAIVTSAVLRQARGIVTEESVAGSDAGDALFGGDGLSGAGFSRGWFDSGTATPQEVDPQDYQGRVMVPCNAAISGSLAADRSLTALGGSSMGVCMFSSRHSHDTAGSKPSSTRPTGTPPAAGAAVAAAARAMLSESDTSKQHKVLLQDSGTVFMWEVPGVVVAADSSEGSQVAAANTQYAAQLAARDASDKFTASSCQTLVPLRKHREVQSSTSSSSDAACQACRWDIDDSYAALNKSSADDGEEHLGCVLPSGAVVATGLHGSGYQSSSQQASYMRSSQHNWGRPSATSAGDRTRRTTNLDSCVAGAWGRPSSIMRGSQASCKREASYGGSSTGAAAAAALLAAAAGPQPEPWTRLAGLAEALAVMEAAISQNMYLPQLLQYRDIRPPPPPSSQLSAVLPDDPLAAGISMSSSGSQYLSVVLPTPGMMSSRPSVALLSSCGAAADAWASSPHGSFAGPGTAGGSAAGASPFLGGAASAAGLRAAGSVAGTGQPASLSGFAGATCLSQLSRRPSQQPPSSEGAGGSRQSSFVSVSSSRLMRGSRPPAGLVLLWTWCCALTDGMPATSIAWNGANTNLVAAGYRSNPAADAAAAAAEADAAGRAPGSAGSTSSGGRPATAARSIRESMKIGAGAGEGAGAGGVSAAAAAAAEVAGAAGGRVALWSLKNQLHPIWTFETKSAVTALDFSQRNPHILGVGAHDGTIAVYDVRSRQPTPLMASTSDTGKHSDPVWKVRWLDRGPEREEQLVSISTDGKVKAWTIAKGLEHTTLITLKRASKRLTSAGGSGAAAGVAAAAAAAGGGAVGLPAGSGAKAAATVAALRSGVACGGRDALISRNTGGMSFDFSGTDSRIFLAGTEDGHIHKCSTSYSEQYLESYSGHIGPVYALQWSPFAPNLFLSCSGDWTIRMWQEGRQQQLLSFQSSNEEVLNVQWCPSNSTVFGAVTAGGRLELWDFSASTLRPVVQHASTKCAMTALLFAKDAPVVIAASDAGGLMVFRLVNVAADSCEPPELQQMRLEEALRANWCTTTFKKLLQERSSDCLLLSCTRAYHTTAMYSRMMQRRQCAPRNPTMQCSRTPCSRRLVAMQRSSRHHSAGSSSTGQSAAAAAQPTAVITGCSTGIGRDTALMLAQNGWHVYAGARADADLRELRQLHDGITPVQLDVTSCAAHAAAAQTQCWSPV